MWARLRNIYATLWKPAGRAVILVPNGPNLFGTLDKVLGHCRRYTEQQLVAVAQEAGFHVEEILKFNRAGVRLVAERKDFAKEDVWAWPDPDVERADAALPGDRPVAPVAAAFDHRDSAQARGFRRFLVVRRGSRERSRVPSGRRIGCCPRMSGLQNPDRGRST